MTSNPRPSSSSSSPPSSPQYLILNRQVDILRFTFATTHHEPGITVILSRAAYHQAIDKLALVSAAPGAATTYNPPAATLPQVPGRVITNQLPECYRDYYLLERFVLQNVFGQFQIITYERHPVLDLYDANAAATELPSRQTSSGPYHPRKKASPATAPEPTVTFHLVPLGEYPNGAYTKVHRIPVEVFSTWGSPEIFRANILPYLDYQEHLLQKLLIRPQEQILTDIMSLTSTVSGPGEDGDGSGSPETMRKEPKEEQVIEPFEDLKLDSANVSPKRPSSEVLNSESETLKRSKIVEQELQ